MAHPLSTVSRPEDPVRIVTDDAPWRWLAAGWQDLRRSPAVSVGYGALFVLAAYGLTLGLAQLDVPYLILPLAAGFMLVAPVLAVGLYDMSRRLERGEAVRLGSSLLAWRRNAREIAFMGGILMLFLLFWVRLAMLLFALFYGTTSPSLAGLASSILSSAGLPFLVVGTAVGGVLALAVFAISAVSIPMLLDRQTDALSATVFSVRAVLRNAKPMLLWAGLIAFFIGLGLATMYVGLALALPLIGHATWHAYRDVAGQG